MIEIQEVVQQGIKRDFADLREFLNKNFFKDYDTTVEEYLFNQGMEYCKEKPAFYADCLSFWNAYTEFYYVEINYFLQKTTENTFTKDMYDYIKQASYDLNNKFKITEQTRGYIFIEHNRRIDAKIDANIKNASKSTKGKRNNLKSI